MQKRKKTTTGVITVFHFYFFRNIFSLSSLSFLLCYLISAITFSFRLNHNYCNVKGFQGEDLGTEQNRIEPKFNTKLYVSFFFTHNHVEIPDSIIRCSNASSGQLCQQIWPTLQKKIKLKTFTVIFFSFQFHVCTSSVQCSLLAFCLVLV